MIYPRNEWIWKAAIIVEKDKAPAEAEAQLLSHVVNELAGVKHNPMQNANENFSQERFWLVKFAPFRTSWSEIVRRGIFTLRGVRNPQARNYIADMRVHDPVLFYHSQQELKIVGLMEVIREAYPDPTSLQRQWLTCDFTPVQTLPHPITLAEIKTNPALKTLLLVHQPRLSVMPVTPTEFEEILAIGANK